MAVEPADPPASREGKLTLLGGLSQLSRCDFVLMVGDKPVDARVSCGLPPFRMAMPMEQGLLPAQQVEERSSTAMRRYELAFGFFNERPAGESAVPTVLSEWQSAFHLLAHRGNDCSFAPVTALLRALLC